jgi:tryptophan synthase alpha chain
MTNRLNQLFERKKNRILSIYFTAGYPSIDDTVRIAVNLEKAGADLIEIGIPFSDPVADGPTIQKSNQVALDNGMSVELLFKQLSTLRKKVNIPVILMGYFNPVLQYGIERFCVKCKEIGIDGLIIPDLPLEVYEREYKSIFETYGLSNILLITPQTNDERIQRIDDLSTSFIYVVSSASVTGVKKTISEDQQAYFDRINQLKLASPKLIGFGISNHETFDAACDQAKGAIIGSAFIKMLSASNDLEKDIYTFCQNILHKE